MFWKRFTDWQKRWMSLWNRCLSLYLEQRISFELFKSRICHQVRDSGDIDFMIRILENDTILLNITSENGIQKSFIFSYAGLPEPSE